MVTAPRALAVAPRAAAAVALGRIKKNSNTSIKANTHRVCFLSIL